MCGIAGAFGFSNEHMMGEMLDDLTHRGPDEEGYHIDDDLMIGARRLSIVDIEGGQQPMWNEAETVCATLNGEIYNHGALRDQLRETGHDFSSRCDTEVLVHLWEEYGTEMLDKIEGMFAFAIWDSTAGTVFLARDRVGIKPLYYSVVDGGVVWASELPTLLAAGVSRDVSKTALSEYLTLSYVTAPRTILESVNKLPPASSAVIDTTGISIDHYWTVPAPQSSATGRSLSKEIASLLETAVEKRLMADVPVGAFLSGGLDSSAIVGLMSRQMDDPVKTYSIEFTDDAFDESEYSDTVASHFGTDHHVISTDLSDLDIFETAVANMNEPIPDPAILPTSILASEAAQSVKVVQTGSGGDELFCGYDRWNMIANHRNWVKHVPESAFSVPDVLAEHSSLYTHHLHYLSSLRDDSTSIANYFSGQAFSRRASTEAWTSFDHATVQQPATTVRSLMDRDSRNPPERIYEYLIRGWLPSRLLQKVDTATMNASLEARVPFLDRELLETAVQIPFRLKTDGEYKPVLRKAVEDFIPQPVLEREKMGFGVPFTDWIESRREPIERWLSESQLQRTPHINADRVRAAYAEQYRGDGGHSRLLFRVLVYAAWYEQVVRPS
jgi:asparagine synthase (glutamine-hydrolysing)